MTEFQIRKQAVQKTAKQVLNFIASSLLVIAIFVGITFLIDYLNTNVHDWKFMGLCLFIIGVVGYIIYGMYAMNLVYIKQELGLVDEEDEFEFQEERTNP